MGFIKFLLSLIALVSVKSSMAQKKFNAYLMPTVSADYSLTKNFSQGFEVESRNFLYRDDATDLVAKHLELTHFTSYKPGNKEFSLGIKYRFEADRTDENELRLIQQYQWKKNNDAKLTHRLRAEERIYKSVTKFRLRYKIEWNFKPKTFADDIYYSNEFAIETNEAKQIELENRFALETGWDLTKKISLVTGLQYRLSDFTNQSINNLFFTAGLEFNL